MQFVVQEEWEAFVNLPNQVTGGWIRGFLLHICLFRKLIWPLGRLLASFKLSTDLVTGLKRVQVKLCHSLVDLEVSIYLLGHFSSIGSQLLGPKLARKAHHQDMAHPGGTQSLPRACHPQGQAYPQKSATWSLASPLMDSKGKGRKHNEIRRGQSRPKPEMTSGFWGG